jgi:hypothetical protein
MEEPDIRRGVVPWVPAPLPKESLQRKRSTLEPTETVRPRFVRRRVATPEEEREMIKAEGEESVETQRTPVVPQQLPKESLRRQRSTQPPNVEVGYGMEDTAESESDAKFTDFSKRLAERERLLGRKLNSAEWLEIIRPLQDVANPPPLKRERRYSIPR